MEQVKHLSVHFENEDDEFHCNNNAISPRKDSVTEILEQTPKLESDTEIKKKCVLGICCMDAKGKSKSMKTILQRLAAFPELDIIFFGEKTIFQKEVEAWPEVDCLLAFFSTGFPLEKAIKYQQLHPTTYCFNDLSWQAVLLDRRHVYDVLKKNSIPTVKNVTMSRDGKFEETPTFYEARDFIEVNGKRIYKPFVEKPVDSEDHNVYIYYHSRQGGGSTRLFRKIGNKSSSYHPDVNNVRRSGSYIYEEFIATDNRQDIKVYTLGIDAAFAEARKAPAVDGIVERGPDGKEIRETVQLSEEEQTVVRKIVKAFKQQFCGFDVLRKNGHSYVCDVNGWSFVKNNDKYFDHLSQVTKDLCLQALISKGLPFVKVEEGVRHLKGVVAVFRHADRTPKQKVKLKTSNPLFLSFFNDGPSEVKIKNEKGNSQIPFLCEEVKKLLDASDKVIPGVDDADYSKIQLVYFVLHRGFGGTKIQLKPIKTEVVDGIEKVTKALLICKWGGVLTHAGIRQSHGLGGTFYERVLPPDPSDKEEFCKKAEFFSNNERRVHKTAKEFAKGLLRMNALPNSVVQDNKETAKLLGDIAAGKELMNTIKQKLFEVLHMENPSATYDYPGLDEIGNPMETMREMHALMKELYHDIHPSASELCEKETIPMMEQRWKRLTHLFYDIKTRTFDTTKIPDVFDYITYDAVHNQSALKDNDLSRLFEKAEKLARFVVPEEYGLEPTDKLYIGSLICEPLVKKLYQDILELTKTLDVGCKFYFSSESHLHTLRNVLLHSNSTIFHELIEPVELSYLTHLVFKVWEHLDVPAEDPSRFRIEVLFSSGTHNYPFDVFNQEHRQAVRPMVSVNDHLTLAEFEETVQTVDAVCKKLNAEGLTKSQEE